MEKGRKFVIAFQEHEESRLFYWTGDRYKYRYRRYADLSLNIEFAKVFRYMGGAVRALESLRTNTANKGVYKIIELEVPNE